MSYNGTCGVSQLPIHEDEKAVLIPMVIKNPDLDERGSPCGPGPVDNNVFAQPFALPIKGSYNGGGGLDPEAGVALDLLESTLTSWAAAGKLFRSNGATLSPCNIRPGEALEALLSGDLRVQAPNLRKEAVKSTVELVAQQREAGNGAGLSHYDKYFDIDLSAMPDFNYLGLSVMLVQASMFDALVETEAKQEAFGYWDDGKNALVTFKGSRYEELMNLYSDYLPTLVTLASKLKEEEPEPASYKSIFAQLCSVLLPEPVPRYVTSFFGMETGDEILFQVLGEDNNAMREALVEFIIFEGALRSMRKQWIPQTGAGSSCDLGEVIDLYQAFHRVMAETLANN